MIRTATIDDLPELVSLEELSWSPHLRASAAALLSRVTTYPQGQYVVEVDRVVRGVLYTQRIKDVDEMTERGFAAQASLHDPSGSFVQLMAINVPRGKLDMIYAYY